MQSEQPADHIEEIDTRCLNDTCASILTNNYNVVVDANRRVPARVRYLFPAVYFCS